MLYETHILINMLLIKIVILIEYKVYNLEEINLNKMNMIYYNLIFIFYLFNYK